MHPRASSWRHDGLRRGSLRRVLRLRTSSGSPETSRRGSCGRRRGIVTTATHSDVNLFLGTCPVPISDYKEIVLAHGSGGKLSQELMHRIVLPQFSNPLLDPLH